MIKKIISYLVAKYHYYFKYLILNVFYRKKHTMVHLQMPLSLILSIFFFQKIIGLNRHIKYPVHFTNTIGRTGFLDIHLSSAGSLASSFGLYIQTINGVVIKENTEIASGTKIISANHLKDDLNDYQKINPIYIGSYCWLGANSVILPSVFLADKTIVGAGAIVTKSVKEKGKVLVGNPAKIK